MTTEPSYIVSYARTPFARFNGSFSEIPATRLGGYAIAEAISRAGLPMHAIDEVIMGNVLGAGLGQNPARQAAISAGVPPSVSAATVNKVCGSGLYAAILADRSIRCGDSDIVVAGGMENMTRAPYLLRKARLGYRMGNDELVDSLMNDGLIDAYEPASMGVFAEATAKKLGFRREEQDDYAVISNQRAIAAIEAGAFATEIVSVSATADKRRIDVSEDEQPRRFNEEKLRSLKPAFAEDGTITAGSASSINDGAGALIVASRQACERHGLSPVAQILGYSMAGGDSSEFTVAPVAALDKLLLALSLSVADIDLFEINEAFAVTVLAAMGQLNIPHAKVNIHGGAVALGHPLGASGARVLMSLLNGLARTGGSTGIATLCIGGGEAVAMALKLQ
jgi:acetyl-CoA C-acetyltransferase